MIPIKPDLSSIDFSTSPFIVIWETTRSCALKCVHCRAEAIDQRDPEELTREEAFALLKEVRRFGQPLVVLTGGDPLRRPELFEIVKHGSDLGLRMALTPSGTPEVTLEKLIKLKENGLARLAVSLDGSKPELHDTFRRVPGSYDWTLNIIRWANSIGLPVQINTTITKHNLLDVDEIVTLLESLKIVLWSVFFLVPVGRGRLEDEVSARDYEKIFHKMVDLSLSGSFDIKSTEAPHYRRVVIQRKKAAGQGGLPVRAGSFVWPATGLEDGIGRAAKGVNDGNGFVFISHTGEIWPSGFLPLTAGNVKKDSLVDVYRNSEIFKGLRDYSKLKGKCGVCEYKSVCGGSRARAYAVTGELMGSDPFCVYIPKGYLISGEEKKFWNEGFNVMSLKNA